MKKETENVERKVIIIICQPNNIWHINMVSQEFEYASLVWKSSKKEGARVGSVENSF